MQFERIEEGLPVYTIFRKNSDAHRASQGAVVRESLESLSERTLTG